MQTPFTHWEPVEIAERLGDPLKTYEFSTCFFVREVELLKPGVFPKVIDAACRAWLCF